MSMLVDATEKLLKGIDPSQQLTTKYLNEIDNLYSILKQMNGRQVAKLLEMPDVTTQTASEEKLTLSPKPAPKKTAKRLTTEEVNQRRGIIDLWIEGVEARTVDAIEDISTAAMDQFFERVDKAVGPLQAEVDRRFKELAETTRITIDYHGTITTMPLLTHQTFPELLLAVDTEFPVMLVGPAGTGKTYGAEQLAKTLDLDFYAISVGTQTSKSDLLGYMTADGTYIATQFRKAYEHGGLFLTDEIDAGNANVLIVLNAALSGHFCAFPDKMVEKHPNFRFVGTANTYGTGANRQYVGRNQLDAATIDRFITLDWNVDEKLECNLVRGYLHGLRWQRAVSASRSLAETRDYRVVISPRATLKGAKLLERDVPFEKVLQLTILANAAAGHKDELRLAALGGWNA